MTTTTGFGGLLDTSRELDRLTDQLAARFPAIGRDEIDQLIRETYDSLSGTATVRSYLLTVTASVVLGRIRGRAFSRVKDGISGA